MDISRALRIPTALGSRAVNPHVGTASSSAWVSAKLARSEATTNEALRAISSPPETQAPFTAAMTGVVIARRARPGLAVKRAA